LATHGVDRNQAALQQQRVQQFWNGGDFVRLLRRWQKPSQPFQLLPPPIRHIHPVIRPAQDGAQRHQQKFLQGVVRMPRAGVLQIAKVIQNRRFWGIHGSAGSRKSFL